MSQQYALMEYVARRYASHFQLKFLNLLNRFVGLHSEVRHPAVIFTSIQETYMILMKLTNVQ